MFTIIQSLLIAAPVLYLALGVTVAARTRYIYSEQPPLWVWVKSITAIVLIAPWIGLARIGRGAVCSIERREDDYVG